MEFSVHESNKHKTENANKKHQPQSSLPESAGGRCSLFLGQLDQGLIGNAESTHVNRPKGKAMFVPWVEDAANMLGTTIS